MANAVLRSEKLPRSLWHLWIAVFAVLIAGWFTFPAQAQQSDLMQSLQSHNGDSCSAQKSCCGSCGSCDSGPHCPAGYTVYDDYCLPECPPGQNRYPGYPGYCSPPCHHGCEEGYEPVPLPGCPEGYYRNLRNPEECLPYRTPDDPYCGEGMTYSRETGKCAPVCLDGTYLGENGLCQSYYARECPAKYTRNPRTGACVPPGSWPDDYTWMCMPVCPPDYTRDIYHPTRCIPPEDKCDQGYETYRDQCVPVCEPGTQRNSYGYCEPPRCQDGSYPDLRGRCRQPECPDNYDNIRGRCYEPCKQGTIRSLRNPEQCEQIPQDEPKCRDGTKLNRETGQCEQIPQDEPKCRNGTKLNRETGQCERISVDPKCRPNFTFNKRTKRCDPPPREERDCPEGLTKTRSGKCINLDDGAPQEPDRPILKLPRLCGEGMIYSKRQRRCVRDPDQQRQPEFDPEPNNDLPTLRRGNTFKLPTFDTKQCEEGTAPDKNGRCMPIQ